MALSSSLCLFMIGKIKKQLLKNVFVKLPHPLHDLIINLQCRAPPPPRGYICIYINPPFSETVETNVAKLFFRLLDKHLPKSHLLHKIFNRNTIKVSYSCMNNVSQIIKQHNKNVSNKSAL